MGTRKGMCVWAGCPMPAWSEGQNLFCPHHSKVRLLSWEKVDELRGNDPAMDLLPLHELEYDRDCGKRYLVYGRSWLDGAWYYAVHEIHDVTEHAVKTMDAPVEARAR